LEEERRLSDSRFAADENCGSWHDAAAKNAVELVKTDRRSVAHVGTFSGSAHDIDGGPGSSIHRRGLSDQRFLGSALGTESHPLGRPMATR
jgi:hypothetical protein